MKGDFKMNLEEEIYYAKLEALKYAFNRLIADLTIYMIKFDEADNEAYPLTILYKKLVTLNSSLNTINQDEIESFNVLHEFLRDYINALVNAP